MSERALLFLISLAVMILALAAAVWLIATGQLGTFDGNFLFLTSLLVAGAFGLYLKYLLRTARPTPAKPSTAPALPAKKPAETPPVQSPETVSKE